MKQVKSRNKRRLSIKTPSSGTVIRYEKRRTDFPICAVCGVTLQGTSTKLSISRTKKRPSRPFGGTYCSRCMRNHFKGLARPGKQ